MISLQNALPLFIFLIAAFLVFYFLETVMLFILNRLLRRYWVLVVDKLLRTIVHHRILMRMLAVGSIALLIILLFVFTPLADLLIAGTHALRLLALVLIFTMGIIYWIGHNNIHEVVFEQRVHLYLFIIFSLISFTAVMALAQQSYPVYEEAVNQAFVKPLVTGIEEDYEKRIEDRLLSIFRKQVKAGECEYFDYASKKGTGLTQFVFVKDDTALADKNPSLPSEEGVFRGQNCVHQTKFLLTPEGKWYEVIE